MKKNKSSPKAQLSILELPNNNIDMEEYIQSNKLIIYNQVVDSIEFAIEKRWPTVEIFSFYKTDFLVAVHYKDFEESLQLAFDFGMENEHYELCAKAHRLIEKIKKMNFVRKYKLNTDKPDVKKEPSAKKSSKRARNK